MLAFGNDTALKAFLLDRLAEYREADRPIGDPNRLSGECDAVVRTLEALQTWRRFRPPITMRDCTRRILAFRGYWPISKIKSSWIWRR